MGAGADDFEQVLARARVRDRAAWELLYRRFAPIALGYLRSQRIPNDEDLLSEVWLQVVRDLAGFSGDAQQFRSWLLRITHHRLLDARKVAARRAEIIEQVPQVPHESTNIDADALEHLHEAAIEQVQRLLVGLPDNQRAVLYLRFVLDLSQREIAVVLGSSTAAVKMLQMRGIRAAAKRLSDEQDGQGGAP